MFTNITETFENPAWPDAEHLKIFCPVDGKERFILVYSQLDEMACFANKQFFYQKLSCC